MSDFDPIAAGQATAKENAKVDEAGITEPTMVFDQAVGTAEVTTPEGPVLTDEVTETVEEEVVEEVEKPKKAKKKAGKS